MAKFKHVSSSINQAIAIKASKLLSHAVGRGFSLGASPINLEEDAIEIWRLPPQKIIGPTNNLDLIANQTGRWHHQIKSANGVHAYIETQPLGPEPEDWDVLGAFESELSSKIDEAITWVDSNITDESLEARLLDLPEYATVAFWLRSESKHLILLIVAPEEYGFEVRTRTYTNLEFLEVLRSVRPIEGITD